MSALFVAHVQYDGDSKLLSISGNSTLIVLRVPMVFAVLVH